MLYKWKLLLLLLLLWHESIIIYSTKVNCGWISSDLETSNFSVPPSSHLLTFLFRALLSYLHMVFLIFCYFGFSYCFFSAIRAYFSSSLGTWYFRQFERSLIDHGNSKAFTDFIKFILTGGMHSYFRDEIDIKVQKSNPQGVKGVCGFMSWSSWWKLKGDLQRIWKVTLMLEREFHTVFSIISDFGEKYRWSKNKLITVLTIAFKWRILILMKHLYTYPDFFPLINILCFFCYLVENASISWLSVFSTFLSVLIVFDCLQTKKANNLFLLRRVFCLQKSENISNELGPALDPRRRFWWSSDRLSEHPGNG